jgi:hypothetical protein
MQGRVLLGAALVAMLFAAGCGSTPRNDAGEVTASASSDAFQVKVGDCTGEVPNGTVTTVTLLPCEQEHYYQAYASKMLTDATFPGSSAISDQADTFCTESYQPWSGIPLKDSEYDMVPFTPTEESWKANDREILCLIGTDEGGIKGSLKGAKK